MGVSGTLVERGSIGRDPVAAQRHLIIAKKKREKEIRHRRDRAAPLTRGREGSELSEWGRCAALIIPLVLPHSPLRPNSPRCGRGRS
jgi:hypothetical protein